MQTPMNRINRVQGRIGLAEKLIRGNRKTQTNFLANQYFALGTQPIGYNNFTWSMSYQNIDSPCCTSETSIILQVDSISVEKENIPWLTFWRLIAFASMFAQVLILYEITTWLQTGHMDSLTVLETRDLKSASLGAHQGVGRRGFSRSLWGEDALPCLCY